jgi:hypothetical protein
MITFIIGFALGGALGILAMCLVAVNSEDRDDRP